MEAITIVLRSGMGMQLTSVRPYLKPGTPIAIGRGGAVIADVVEGNTIEDKRQAAESAAGYIDSVESRLEGAESLELVVSALERTLLCIEKHAVVGQTGTTRQAMDALGNIRELAAAFLDQSGAREQPVKTGEPPYSAPTSACCGICSQQDHVDENCPWQGARAGLALVQQIDRHLVEHAQEFNAAPSEALKPGIFDIITGTAGQVAPVPQVLPSTEEHAAQIERVAADLREHGPDRVALKPCAFCGGPPVPFVQLASQGFGSAPRMDSYGDDGLSIEAFVYCHECGANGPTFEDDIFDASDYDQAMAEGVRLWQDRDGRHADLYEANAADGQNLFPRPDMEVV